MESLETAWNEVVEDEASKNEEFARVWNSLKEFRKGYKIWGDLGYLD